MSSKTMIYMIRHGETDWNNTHRLQGVTDVPLNTTGKKQARAISKHLKTVTFDAIYSSPLTRALETAQIIAKHHKNTSVIVDPLLLERHFGDFEGLHHDDFNSLHPGYVWTESWHYPDVRSPKGESLHEVIARVKKFFDSVDIQGKSIAIVSHGVTLRLLAAILLHLPLPQLRWFEMDNASLAIIEFDGAQGVLHLSNYQPSKG